MLYHVTVGRATRKGSEELFSFPVNVKSGLSENDERSVVQKKYIEQYKCLVVTVKKIESVDIENLEIGNKYPVEKEKTIYNTANKMIEYGKLGPEVKTLWEDTKKSIGDLRTAIRGKLEELKPEVCQGLSGDVSFGFGNDCISYCYRYKEGFNPFVAEIEKPD
jgi:hypothetical protein